MCSCQLMVRVPDKALVAKYSTMMLKLTFSRERTGGTVMRSIQTRTIVLYGLFIAVIFLLGLTPLGYINLPIAAITTVHIPVIVGG